MKARVTSHRDLAFPCVRPQSVGGRLAWRFNAVDCARCAAAATDRQSSYPIIAYTGANGGGKSAAEVYDVLPTLMTERRWECELPWHYHSKLGITSGVRHVLATLQLFDPTTPVPYQRHHARYVPLNNFGQLLRAEHCEVILDEVTGVMSSRQSQSLPVQVENLIVQMRRRDCRVLWSTPDFSAADVRLRQITQAVVYATGHMKVPSAIEGRAWRDARMFRLPLYGASEFDEFTASKREKLRPRGVQHLWRPGHLINRVYDTLAEVYALGVATDGGMCLSCGGSRSRPRCQCPPDQTAVPEGFVELMSGTGTRTRFRADDPALLAGTDGAQGADGPQRASARTARTPGTARTAHRSPNTRIGGAL